MRTSIAVILGVAIGVAVGIFVSSFSELSYERPSQPVVPALQPVPFVSDEKRQLIFVGDVMLARAVERMMLEYGADYPYAHLGDVLANAFVVGNFEAAMPLLHIPTPSMIMRFSVHPQFIPALAAAGFTHLSLANNHAFDYGNEGYTRAREVLESSDMTPFGDPNMLATSSIAYLTLEGTDVALVGIYAVVEIPSEESIRSIAAEAASRSDVQIVYVHWGEEYMLSHNPAQERLATALIDAGIDAVVGHHPHVVQDVACYKGAPIFYSLGNFIFDQYFSTEVQQGLLLKFAFGADDTIEATLVPVTTESSRTSPTLIAGYERDAFLEALALRSEPTLSSMLKNGMLTCDRS